MLKKIVILCLCFLLLSNIYATNEWWTSAHTFFSGVSWSEDAVLEDLVNLIKFAGNAIFIVVAIVLGIKYMYGSAEGKADVKDGLISLTVAMVLFYGWSTIQTILVDGGNLIFIKGTDTDTVTAIYNTVVYFLNIIATGVVIYVGVKYLMSGAEGKADLKGKGVPFVVGLILTFASVTFLNFLGDVIESIFN